MYPYYMSVEFDSYGSMLNHPTTKGQHTHIKRLNGLQKETQPKKAQKYDEKIRKTPLWDFFSPPLGNDCTNSAACVESIPGDK